MIADNFAEIQARINAAKSPSQHVAVLAATKYAGVDDVTQLIDAGCLVFGENKLQDALDKMAKIERPGIEWHFIGHLQTNKVGKAVKHFDCIQSVDSVRLAEKIDGAAHRLGKCMPVFIQINIGEEDAKYGFRPTEISSHVAQLKSFSNIQIVGIMIVTPFSTTSTEIDTYYKTAAQLFDRLKPQIESLTQLSMGVSHDFEAAVKAGATMVRIGRRLFREDSV